MSKTIHGTVSAFAGTYADYHPNNLIVTTASPIQHSALQHIHQEKLQLCETFISAFAGTGFFDKSFPSYGNMGNGCNRAMSVLMSRAIAGTYLSMSLDYSKVMISKGRLTPAEHAAAVPTHDSNIYFTFTDNSNIGSAADTDAVILVAYVEELQQAIFSLQSGLRKDCEAELSASSFKGHTVQTWIGFLSKDGFDASNSVYTGVVNL